MDLLKLNTLLTQNSAAKIEHSRASKPLVPPPPPKPENEEKAEGDQLDISKRRARTESKDEEIARKLADKLNEKEKKSTSDILKIVSENNPNVMKSIRAIIAQRAGLEKDATKGPDLDLLASALKEAAGSPDPSRRIADVVGGVGLVPDEMKDKFLETAQKILGMEKQATEYAVTHPFGSESDIEIDPTTGNYEPTQVGFAMEVNFDLFFSVSARQSMSWGESDAGSFYEASAEVAARFESNFSMEISGRFFTLADLAQEIDPAVLDSFSKAVQGLAGFDDESLNRFFDATEELFDEVEQSLGLAKDSLDGVAKQMKQTAVSFFESVSAATNDVFPGLELDQVFSLPEELDSNGSTDLLQLIHDLAAKRDPKKDADGLMKALTSAENARGLGSMPPPPWALPDFESMMQELQAIPA